MRFPCPKLVLLATSTLLAYQANSADLRLGFLKTGNAHSTEQDFSYSDNYRISVDGNKILRRDLQFEVTSALGVSKDDKGKSVLIPYAGTEEVKFNSNDLSFTTGDIRFGASNLTYWLGKTVDMAQDQGFLRSKKMDIKVYSHCQDMLNAYFHPKENHICVGHLHKSLGRTAHNGMASLSWDADVIVHEMGHGIFNHLITMSQNNYLSFGNDMLRAMNEGQADFMAHVVTGTDELAPWMMTLTKSYYKKFNPKVYDQVKNKKALRPIKNTLRLDSDYFGEIHDDGSIIAGALYDLANTIGKENALKLWLGTVTNIHEANNYFDHGQIMLERDQAEFNGRHHQDIIESFSKHGIFGNDALEEGDISIKARIVDKPKYMTYILESLGIKDKKVIEEFTNKLNSNGKIDKDECVSVELEFTNESNKLLVGLEMFLPTTSVPKGLKSEGQNRNFLGSIKSGQAFPKEINLMNKRRPWILLCADENFDPSKPLPITLKSSSEGYTTISINLNGN